MARWADTPECSTGRVPEFYEDLRSRGLAVDMSIFKTQGAPN